MENLFYYTGVTVWVLIALVTIYVLMRLCAVVIRKHILPTLSNIRIGLFGKKRLGWQMLSALDKVPCW